MDSMPMNPNNSSTEFNILTKLAYQQQQRKYILTDLSFAKILFDLRIGTKIPIPQSDSQSQSHPPSWSLQPQQLVYLLSCLNLPISLIIASYSKMSCLQVTCTTFYLWMRKRSRLLRKVDECRYKVYMNIQSYTLDKPMYTIKICEYEESLADIMLNGVRANKIAIVRNRDIVVVDVVEGKMQAQASSD